MAKRQGGKSKGAPRAHKPKALKRSDNKMVRWKTSDDISMDEEDECMLLALWMSNTD